VVRRFRLISGLILFAYVLTHFVNHSLGIISIAAMEAMLAAVYPIWSFPPVTFLLYGALVTHMTLALYALWQRRSLKLTVHETVQYVLGFSVPLLLAEHVTNTRIAAAFYGGDFGHYKYVLSAFGTAIPKTGCCKWRSCLPPGSMPASDFDSGCAYNPGTTPCSRFCLLRLFSCLSSRSSDMSLAGARSAS